MTPALCKSTSVTPAASAPSSTTATTGFHVGCFRRSWRRRSARGSGCTGAEPLAPAATSGRAAAQARVVVARGAWAASTGPGPPRAVATPASGLYGAAWRCAGTASPPN